MAEKIIKLIFGKRGSGKSFLAAHLLDQYDRYMVFDTLHEYRNGVVFDDRPMLARFWRDRYRAAQFKLIYRPTQPAAEIENISEWAWKCGDLCYLVEEIDAFCTAQKPISVNLANIIQRGRHKNITLIGVTQRPFGIPRILTSQAKEICIFRTNEPRDREYLRSLTIGADIDTALDGLEQYEFLRWKDGSGQFEICKLNTAPGLHSGRIDTRRDNDRRSGERVGARELAGDQAPDAAAQMPDQSAIEESSSGPRDPGK